MTCGCLLRYGSPCPGLGVESDKGDKKEDEKFKRGFVSFGLAVEMVAKSAPSSFSFFFFRPPGALFPLSVSGSVLARLIRALLSTGFHPTLPIR